MKRPAVSGPIAAGEGQGGARLENFKALTSRPFRPFVQRLVSLGAGEAGGQDPMRDIRPQPTTTRQPSWCAAYAKWSSGKASRGIRRQPAHRLIAKIPRTRCGRVTRHGPQAMGTHPYPYASTTSLVSTPTQQRLDLLRERPRTHGKGPIPSPPRDQFRIAICMPDKSIENISPICRPWIFRRTPRAFCSSAMPPPPASAPPALTAV